MQKYEGSFKQKCEQLGVNYNNARAYKRKHKGIDDNTLLTQYINMLNSEKDTIADICKRANVDEGLYRRIKFSNKELSSKEIIQRCKEHSSKRHMKHSSKRTLAERCRELGISENAAQLYKARHKVSDDEVIQAYLNKKKPFSEKCKDAGVNYQKAVRIKNIEKISEEEAIKKVLKTKKSFKDRCEEENISYRAAIAYRKRYNLTDDQVIEHYKNKVEACRKNKIHTESIAETCRKYNINASSVVTYMSRTGCSLKECIIHFRPDLYLNIFGELMISEN